MNCTICITSEIPQEKMVWLECTHSLCSECYNNLRTNTCPYCRITITNKVNRSNEINRYSESSISFGYHAVNSYTLKKDRNLTRKEKKSSRKSGGSRFVRNRDRSPYQRKKKKFKKSRRTPYKFFSF